MNECQLMGQALAHAEVSLANNEVPIAALLYHEPTQKILAKSHNLTNKTLNGTTHAEFQLYNELRDTFPDTHLRMWTESTLVVTVEPCIMCASLLDQLKVRRVVFGCANDRFGGNGSVFRVQRKYKAVPGVRDHEAIALLRRFYVRENDASPTQIGKKQRVLKTDEYSVLEYSKYIDLEDFVSLWGEESAVFWNENLPLVFDTNGNLHLGGHRKSTTEPEDTPQVKRAHVE